MTRVAALDCGTNSIRLLVAELDLETVDLTDLVRRTEIVRLGQGVDRTRRLALEALERTFTVCRTYAKAMEQYEVSHIRFVATSAIRDAENRADFVSGVRSILGVDPEVVTGAEEANLSFAGSTRELADRKDFDGPFLVFDIGGGSTEFAVGTENVGASCSIDIGAVRMTERHLVKDGVVTDPATPDQIIAIRTEIDAALDEAAKKVPLESARTRVGLAGSTLTVAAIALGLQEYDPAQIHHARVSIHQVREIAGQLLAMTRNERAAIPVVNPGRADVIGVGALILLATMERIGADEVMVSEHDILDGIAWSAT